MKDSPERQSLFQDIRKFEETYFNFSDSELNRLIFKSVNSNRLSKNGFIILEKVYQNYTFKIEDELLPKEFLQIQKFVSIPYYLTRKRLVLFSSKDAFFLSLHGLDIHSWIKNLS